LFLVVALLLTIKVVFDAYSYYVARRSIDAELEAKKISSLEYLTVLQQRERVAMRETLETRCTERAEIALFRIFDVLEEKELKDFQERTTDVRGSLIAEIRENGPKFLDGWEGAVAFVNSPTFKVVGFRKKYITKKPSVAEADTEYTDFIGQIDLHLKKYEDLVLKSPGLQKIAQKTQGESKELWRLQAVNTLETRLKRLKAERDGVRERLAGNLDEILARYGVWTDALTGGAAESHILDEMAVEARREDQAALSDVNCQLLRKYDTAEYARLERESRIEDQEKRVPWIQASTGEKIDRIVRWYNGRLLLYFSQPPAAQTLFVTLFMGVLGGLTVNVLRLSQLSWWRGQKDPLWGEIFVSPILGALAALAIYLVGSAGLLLTSDFRAAQSGGSPLSASFIGLLGFLSGFLYDAAFGRVRRVGAQLFAGDAAADPAQNANEDDRSLAEALKGGNASLVSGLVLTYGIGSKLASESEFTLLVPSDHAVGETPLASWTQINDKTGNAFDTWYKHHHAAKRVEKKDIAGLPAAPFLLALDDGKTVELKVEGDELKVGATKAIVADISWKNGVIHILQDELAP
jgi:hypothetical protein